ncbi:MAG TPA: DUF177 domain-containing protein [Longimicrobiales bacterium]|nr:DUF177 domain-containing protein [Longimicrobiales bacterium]
MLKVDLGQLARQKRRQIDASVPAGDALFQGVAFELHGPLQVQLEAQQAGHDVLVRGTLSGEAELPCRRCLTEVGVPIREQVALLFREGVSEADAEDAEIYPLPEKGHEIDLTHALHEHLVLAVPEFVICREACRGLCPSCGANLNETTCNCEPTAVDHRWAALLQLKGKDKDGGT